MKYEVNIDVANRAKKEMQSLIASNETRVINQPGAFASLYDIDLKPFRHPILVFKTEEPGSKQLLAMRRNRIESVCYDMINHLVNDCIVMGATPLTVQDAIICGKIDADIVRRIVASISSACKENECILTGGETSEQPSVIPDDTYILTSSIVGVVEKQHIVDGRRIAEGDVVIGLASNGLHTNGYTLVRKIIEEMPEIEEETVDGEKFIEVILRPHTSYYHTLKDLFGKGCIAGMAHITGGGIRENLNRILPPGVDAIVDLASYRIPEIFRILKEYGRLDDAEMLRIFNMGVGFIVVATPQNAPAVIEHVKKRGVDAYVIGEIAGGGAQEVTCINNFRWSVGVS
jgi:phosphoribosylformylglycinamidine cyclo-ligase